MTNQYDHIKSAPDYQRTIETAQAALNAQATPWEVQRNWDKEQHKTQFITCIDKRGQEHLAYPLAVHDGLVFVEHPKYGDEAPMQILNSDGTLTASSAWDMDDLSFGDY